MKTFLSNCFKQVRFPYKTLIIQISAYRTFSEFQNEKDYKIPPQTKPPTPKKEKKSQNNSLISSSELSGSDSSTTTSLWESDEEIIPMLPRSLDDEEWVFL